MGASARLRFLQQARPREQEARGVFGRFSIVDVPRDEAGEEEGSQRIGHSEKIVNHAEVFQSEKLRRGGNHDGEVHSVAEAEEDRSDVEGSWPCGCEQKVREYHAHLCRSHPDCPRNCIGPARMCN